MKRLLRGLFVFIIGLFMSFPFLARAFPFGGQIYEHHYCFNEAIYALLGPPIGGPYIWTFSTRTYQFGPPRGVGQWLLGLTGPPIYCVVRRSPLDVREGISIMMMGSSGPAAPSHPALSLSTTPVGGTTGIGTPTGVGSATDGNTGTASSPVSIGHVVISEVYADVDATHGADPTNEWIEIYNGSDRSVNISGWTIEDDSTLKRSLPQSFLLAPASFLILTPASSTSSFWTVIPPTRVVSFGAPIGNGLSPTGDVVILKTASGVVVDAVSWGTNTAAFDPPLAVVQKGHSMSRTSFAQDTNTRSEWGEKIGPNPGAQ